MTWRPPVIGQVRSLNKVGVTGRATGMTVGSREGDSTRFGGVSGRQARHEDVMRGADGE